VGALCARAAVLGAFMNVRINSAGFSNAEFVDEKINKGKEMEANAIELEREILHIVNMKIGI
ncbi:MAG TPA: cyclodeaminase/cyclohydrolase family protein, partial [Chitinophagaceae bacterium]|nr:cyclodeaminase/cyclohydrolase family protein [Chitinophagaceae bacterium]